jgi:hypothetical protein
MFKVAAANVTEKFGINSPLRRLVIGNNCYGVVGCMEMSQDRHNGIGISEVEPLDSANFLLVKISEEDSYKSLWEN